MLMDFYTNFVYKINKMSCENYIHLETYEIIQINTK